MSDRIKEEKIVVAEMIKLYCRHKEGNSQLCSHCTDVLNYAMKRLDNCKYQASKPTCKQCTTHCYNIEMREKIRAIMRYAGPRMILFHPIMAIRHLIREHKHT